MSRVRAKVEGIVQGVGFRYFVMRAAEGFGLKGYVRNCHDGSVEVEAEGTKETLDLLLMELEKGPQMSRVENLTVHWFDDEKGYKDFSLSW